MDRSAQVVIDLWSDEEDDLDCFILDGGDDCIILNSDPDANVEAEDSDGAGGDEGDDVVLVHEKGEIACRDFPHPRHICANYPFMSTSHAQHCRWCHCYICDCPAPCLNWGNGASRFDHCHANDKIEMWKSIKKLSKEEISENVPHHTLQNNGTLNTTTGRVPEAVSVATLPASVVRPLVPPVNTVLNQTRNKSLSSGEELWNSFVLLNERSPIQSKRNAYKQPSEGPSTRKVVNLNSSNVSTREIRERNVAQGYKKRYHQPPMSITPASTSSSPESTYYQLRTRAKKTRNFLGEWNFDGKMQ